MGFPSIFYPFFAAPSILLSFPTRRSSDLRVCKRLILVLVDQRRAFRIVHLNYGRNSNGRSGRRGVEDRKSTRLNSSHLGISYAVFCLKKKKTRRHCRCQTSP